MAEWIRPVCVLMRVVFKGQVRAMCRWGKRLGVAVIDGNPLKLFFSFAYDARDGPVTLS